MTYTAISIYVVGSKLQAYATRPKGGMGRLELILGFRGCRHEMDMEAENTISIALRVLTKSNKNRYDSYCLKAVPLFETVKGLKEYLVQRSGEELKTELSPNQLLCPKRSLTVLCVVKFWSRLSVTCLLT